MPVINLPRDTRGSEIGAALAGATKSLTDAYMQQQTASGVAEIMGNPSISDANKPIEILKKYGDPGYDLFKKMSQVELIGSQVKNVLAEAGLQDVQRRLKELTIPTVQRREAAEIAGIESRTDLTGAQTATARALLPGQVAAQSGDLAKTSAETQNILGQTEARRTLLPGQVEAQGADIARTRSQTEVEQALLPDRRLLAQSQAAQNFGQAQESQLKIDQSRRLMEAQQDLLKGNTTFDQLIQKFGIPAGTPRAEAAKQALATGGFPAFQQEIDKGIGTQEKISEPKPLSNEQRTQLVNSVAQVESAERFVEAFDKGGRRQVGWFPNIAPARAWLEKQGITTADPEFVNMMNSTMQQVSDVARSSSQFYSSGVLNLARDVVPNIQGSPLHAMIAANEAASRKLEQLKVDQGILQPGQPRAELDKLIDRYERFKKDTTVESYTSTPWTVQVQRPDGTVFTRIVPASNTPEPPVPGTQVRDERGQVGQVIGAAQAAGEPKTTVLYKGNVVDPRNFDVIVDKAQVFKVPDPQNPKVVYDLMGSELIKRSRDAGVPPEVYLARLRGQAPETPRSTGMGPMR